MRAQYFMASDISSYESYELNGIRFVEQEVSEINWGSEAPLHRRKYGSSRSTNRPSGDMAWFFSIGLAQFSPKARVLVPTQIVILVSFVVAIFGILNAVQLYNADANLGQIVPYIFTGVVFSIIFAIAIQIKNKFKERFFS